MRNYVRIEPAICVTWEWGRVHLCVYSAWGLQNRVYTSYNYRVAQNGSNYQM